MATASLLKAKSLFLVTWKPSFSCRSPCPQIVPNNLRFIKPSKLTRPSISLNCCFINYSNSTHKAATPFNFEDGQSTLTLNLSPKKNHPFQVGYSAISLTRKALKSLPLYFVLLGLLSMMMLRLHCPDPALAASGGSMGGYSFSSEEDSEPEVYDDDDGVSYHRVSNNKDGLDLFEGFFHVVIISYCLFSVYLAFFSKYEQASIVKLQVGLLGTKGSLQKDLNQIAKTGDTSTSDGWIYILKEATQSLLQHFDYFFSGYSSVNVADSIENGEEWFKQMYTEERRKFDEETLININNTKVKSITNQKAKDLSNEYLVITILVAAIGVHRLPAINSRGDLKEALQMLRSIPMNKIQGVLVLWTPQRENDALSEQELCEKYPILRPLNA